MVKTSFNLLSTGISGLDGILGGGLIAGRSYLVRGGPGSGKTTLGLHFLLAGIAAKQKSLFISMEEQEEKIKANALALGLDTSGIQFVDISPSSSFFIEIQTYDIFSPAEVEKVPITNKIKEIIESLKPERIFIDPITQLRYLSTDIYQYRRQVLSFLRYLNEAGSTVLFTSETSQEAPDADLQFLSDGVIELNYDPPKGFQIQVKKMRGSEFLSRWHSMKIKKGGIEVYPELQPPEQVPEIKIESISSGVAEIDSLLGGGIDRGTVTVITGPTGVGKTSIGLTFMKEASSRGESSIVYTFDEEIPVILHRARSISIPIDEIIHSERLKIMKVEPLRWSIGELTQLVRSQVEEQKARLVMFDSIAGFKLAVRGEDLVAHLHALAKYLQNKGVTVIIICETSRVVGDFQATELGLSYLADTIIFLRYIELNGQLRKAIGVLKKRTGDFEKTLREFEITGQGIRVGEPLSGYQGILLGEPRPLNNLDIGKK